MKILRLTGGSYAGRRLYVPRRGTRPATNRVREAVFSILLSYFENGPQGLNVLDLFAGSGSLGIEALSRGASRCTFVEKDQFAAGSIKKNLELLGMSGEVIQCDVHLYLKREKKLWYDLVFMDPPYRYRNIEQDIELLRGALEQRCSPLLVHERLYRDETPAVEHVAQLLKRKKYGGTEVLYYRVEEGDTV
jgi:16S rRNA (guanine966-N2)-methyltransferase